MWTSQIWLQDRMSPFIKNQQPSCYLLFHHLIPSFFFFLFYSLLIFWKCSGFWSKSSQIAIKCANVASLNCLINLDYADWLYMRLFCFLAASEKTLSIRRCEWADNIQRRCQTSFTSQITIANKCFGLVEVKLKCEFAETVAQL